jgi:hypothetical protein
MMLAGVGWLSALSTLVLRLLSPEVETLGFVAELALMLWLLIKGEPPAMEQAIRSPANTAVKSKHDVH